MSIPGNAVNADSASQARSAGILSLGVQICTVAVVRFSSIERDSEWLQSASFPISRFSRIAVHTPGMLRWHDAASSATPVHLLYPPFTPPCTSTGKRVLFLYKGIVKLGRNMSNGRGARFWRFHFRIVKTGLWAIEATRSFPLKPPDFTST